MFSNLSPGPWIERAGEYGALGLICGALLYMMYVLTTKGLDRIDGVYEKHRQERMQWRQDIQNQQKIWIEEANNRSSRSDAVIEKLTQAIHAQGEASSRVVWTESTDDNLDQ